MNDDSTVLTSQKLIIPAVVEEKSQEKSQEKQLVKERFSMLLRQYAKITSKSIRDSRLEVKSLYGIRNDTISFDQTDQELLLELDKMYKVTTIEASPSPSPLKNSYSSLTKLPKLARLAKNLTINSMDSSNPSISDSQLQCWVRKLDSKKTLMNTISKRVASQLASNYESVLEKQRFQSDNINLTLKLVKTKPSQKQWQKNQNEYNYEDVSPSLKQIAPNAIQKQRQVKSQMIWCESSNESLWRPTVREGACMCNVNRKIYVFGGLGVNVQGQLYSADIDEYKWQTEELLGDKLLPRHGHTMNYNKAIFIIGGELSNEKKQRRYFSGDIIRIDINSKTSKSLKTTGYIFEARRNHAVSEVGKYLVILGGLNKKLQFMSDCLFLNIITLRMEQTIIEGENPFLKGIAYHAQASVFLPDKFKVILFQKPEEDIYQQQDPLIRFEGVYVYGGTNNNQEPYDKLYRLDIYQFPAQWVVVPTKGIRPAALTMHTMIFNESIQCLLIYGGIIEQSETLINDEISILTLKHCVWIKVSQGGAVPKDRFGHCCLSHNTKVIIFGGLSFDGFVTTQISILELDKDVTSKKWEKQNSIFRAESSKLIKKDLSSNDQKQQQKQQQRHQLIQNINQNSLFINYRASIKLSPMKNKCVKFKPDMLKIRTLKLIM